MTSSEVAFAAFEDALDDVHSRFILNLPENELSSADRIFFQLEQAHWYYEDFLVDAPDSNLPHFKSLKAFSNRMFTFSPLLAPMLPQFPGLWNQFSAYKRTISTYGAILLNYDCTEMILCRTWDGKGLTLPSGKMNQNEDGLHAAARETYEETGFDINAEYGKAKAIASDLAKEGKAVPWNVLNEDDQISYMDAGKRRTVYVCRGVPEDFEFEPVARKEVSEVSFFPIDNLPKKTFNVLPFMKGLTRWMAIHGIKRKSKKNRSGSNKKGDRPNSKQKQRAGSTKKDREAFNNNETGWSEEEMFAANEKLYGQKIEYSGNPHEFADSGFDPHKFHVVGGGFMNAPSAGGDGGGGDDYDKKKAAKKLKDVKVVDEDGFVSFFDADGDAPWEGTAEEEDVGDSLGGGQREPEPKLAAPNPPAAKPAKKTKESLKDKRKKQKDKPKPAPIPTAILANPIPKSQMSSTLMNMIGVTAPKASTPIEEAPPFVPASERHGDFFGAATFTFDSGKVLGAVRRVLGKRKP